jgi:chromosome segregation ATPase
LLSKNVHCPQAREEALKAEASKVREKHLEEQLAAAQGASKKLEKEKDRLQRALDVLQVQIKEMSAQADEGQSKVSDALALVDSACQNRDYTVVALSKAQGKLHRFKYMEKKFKKKLDPTEEIVRLEAALKALTEEAKEQVKREVEQVKQQCNLHVRNILADKKRCQEVSFRVDLN